MGEQLNYRGRATTSFMRTMGRRGRIAAPIPNGAREAYLQLGPTVAAAQLGVTARVVEHWRRREQWPYYAKPAIDHEQPKVCSRCNVLKDAVAFRVRKDRGDRYAYCRDCDRAAKTEARRRKGIGPRTPQAYVKGSAADYARHCGCKLDKVREALTKGWIARRSDGTIDYVEADAAWQRKREEIANRGAATRALIARLLAEDPTARYLSPDSQEYRARYRYDPAYRAKELKRRHAQKVAHLTRAIPDDGTLTGDVVQRLFAAAHRCSDCGRRMKPKDKTLDHIVPKSRGGAHSIFNVRVICRSCNSKKKARQPAQLTLAPLNAKTLQVVAPQAVAGPPPGCPPRGVAPPLDFTAP